MKIPDKIYIIGWFGSGKTSLAKKISSLYAIPHFDLDDIRWVKKYSHKLSDSEREKKLSDILRWNQNWIIEWCVIDWANKCYKTADLVVLIKIPWYIAAWRIIKRYISRLFCWRYAWTFLWTLSLMYRAFMYYHNSKGKYSFSRHLEDCKKYKCNYIVIHDINDILD